MKLYISIKQTRLNSGSLDHIITVSRRVKYFAVTSKQKEILYFTSSLCLYVRLKEKCEKELRQSAREIIFMDEL